MYTLIFFITFISLTKAANVVDPCPYGYVWDSKKCIQPNVKIVNGIEAVPNSWPSQVLVNTDLTMAKTTTKPKTTTRATTTKTSSRTTTKEPTTTKTSSRSTTKEPTTTKTSTRTTTKEPTTTKTSSRTTTKEPTTTKTSTRTTTKEPTTTTTSTRTTTKEPTTTKTSSRTTTKEPTTTKTSSRTTTKEPTTTKTSSKTTTKEPTTTTTSTRTTTKEPTTTKLNGQAVKKVRIAFRSSRFQLEADSSQVFAAPSKPTNNQQWALKQVSQDDTTDPTKPTNFFITNVATGLNLASTSSGLVIVTPHNAVDRNQQWWVQQYGNWKFVHIKNDATRLYLDSDNAKKVLTTAIDPNNEVVSIVNKMWSIYDVEGSFDDILFNSTGPYNIGNYVGQFLEADYTSLSFNAKSNTDKQKWMLVFNKDGYFVLTNLANGRVLNSKLNTAGDLEHYMSSYSNGLSQRFYVLKHTKDNVYYIRNELTGRNIFSRNERGGIEDQWIFEPTYEVSFNIISYEANIPTTEQLIAMSTGVDLIVPQIIRNPSDAEITTEVSYTRKYTDTFTYGFSQSLSLGVKVTTSGSIPFIASASMEVTASVGVTANQEMTKSEEKTIEIRKVIKVQPHSSIQAFWTLRVTKNIRIPFKCIASVKIKGLKQGQGAADATNSFLSGEVASIFLKLKQFEGRIINFQNDEVRIELDGYVAASMGLFDDFSTINI